MTQPPDTTPRLPLPWERQSNETEPAWEAFARYRDLGRTRSLSRLASELVGTTPNTPETPPKHPRNPDSVRRQIGRWSSVHGWRDRVIAWDNEVDRRVREDAADEIIEMRKRQARYSEALMTAGIGPALELLDRLKDKRLSYEDMPAGDLVKVTIAFARIYPALAQAERLTRGEAAPTVVVEHSMGGSGELGMSDKALIELWGTLETLGIAPHPEMPQIAAQSAESES